MFRTFGSFRERSLKTMMVRSQTALRELKRWRSYVLVVVGAYLLTVALGAVLGPLRGNLDNLVFDQYQRWKPRPYDFSQPVRIVDIDDESIHLVGRWPWGRQTMADLVEALDKAKVAAVGFDFLFSEKDRPKAMSAACAEGAAHSADAVARCQGRVDGDAAFAKRSRDAPSSSARSHADPQRLAGEPHDQGGVLLRRRSADLPGRPFNGVLAPIAELAEAAEGLGFLNWLPDNDRVVRRVPLLLESTASSSRASRSRRSGSPRARPAMS